MFKKVKRILSIFVRLKVLRGLRAIEKKIAFLEFSSFVIHKFAAF